MPDGATERALRPGDVVAFFAEARDRGHATRSALYFADVRPFERRYREQQGSGGGGSGGPGIDIAARQRDIVSATWNLIRERDSGARVGQELADRTDMLALLQERLMAQVDTLIERSEGRGLSASAEIDVFVTELAQAREHMAPAVERLAEHALAEALPLEQKALQHALAAEAGLRDVNVTLSSEGQPGNGGMDRSLSELIDLEMDPERNRYEVPRQPGSENGQPTDDAEWRRLAELARRQEALARSAGPEEMPVSRWQRERLSRELEEMRETPGAGGCGQVWAHRRGDRAPGRSAQRDRRVAARRSGSGRAGPYRGGAAGSGGAPPRCGPAAGAGASRRGPARRGGTPTGPTRHQRAPARAAGPEPRCRAAGRTHDLRHPAEQC